MTDVSKELRALAADPFALLKALEQSSVRAARGRSTAPQSRGEWVGVGFRLDGRTFVVPRDEVGEIMKLPVTTRVPGASRWIAGVANVRGQLLPIVDVSSFTAGGAAVPQRETRVIVATVEDVTAGFIVDEVLGFRRFASSEFLAESPTAVDLYKDFLAGAYRRGDWIWNVFSLHKLMCSEKFEQPAESAPAALKVG